MKKHVIVAVASGFYFFGVEATSPDERFMRLTQCAMFGGFSGGKGMPGVARGDKDAYVTLDFFDESSHMEIPLSAVLFVVDSIDLSTWNNATIR